MGRPIKRTESSTSDINYGSGYGGTIGQPYAQTGVYTISTTYADSVGNDIQQGYINQQRSKDRFVMMNATSIGSNQAVCLLVNSTDGNVANLAANTGIVLCYNTSNVQFYAQYITSKFVWDFSTPPNRYIYKINTVATANWANVASA
jgi:hypothetical protein